MSWSLARGTVRPKSLMSFNFLKPSVLKVIFFFSFLFLGSSLRLLSFDGLASIAGPVYVVGWPILWVWIIVQACTKRGWLRAAALFLVACKAGLYLSSTDHNGFCWSLLSGEFRYALQVIYGPQNPLVIYDVFPFLIRVDPSEYCLFKVMDSFLHVDKCGMPLAQFITYAEYLDGARLQFEYLVAAGSLLPFTWLLTGAIYYTSLLVWNFGLMTMKGSTAGILAQVGVLFVNYFFFFAGPVGPYWVVSFFNEYIAPQASLTRLTVSLVSVLIQLAPTWLARLDWAQVPVSVRRFWARFIIFVLLVLFLYFNFTCTLYLISLVFVGGYFLALLMLPVAFALTLMAALTMPDAVLYLVTGSDFSLVARLSPALFAGLANAGGAIFLLTADTLDFLSAWTVVVLHLCWQGVSHLNRAWRSMFEINYFTEDSRYLSVRMCLIIEALLVWLLPFNMITVVTYSLTISLAVVSVCVSIASPILYFTSEHIILDPIIKGTTAFWASTVYQLCLFFIGLWASLETRFTNYFGIRGTKMSAVKSAIRFFMVVTLPLFMSLYFMLRIWTASRQALRFIVSLPFRIVGFLITVLIILLLPDAVFAFVSSLIDEVVARAKKSYTDRNGFIWMICAWVAMSSFGVALGIDSVEFRKGLADSVLGQPLPESEEITPTPSRLASLYTAKMVNLTRKTVLKVLNRLDEVKLPEFINKQYTSTDREQLRSTYQVLSDVGIPVVDNFFDALGPEADPTGNPYLMEFMNLKDKVLASTSFKLGFTNPEIAQHPWVQWIDKSFMEGVRPFITSASFTGAYEELKSTMRYYSNEGLEAPEVDDMDFRDIAEGAFAGVKSQFADSKLTSLVRIFNQWYANKKFSFGFGVGTNKKSGRVVQSSREQVVSSVGGKKKFIEFMEYIFYHGSNLMMPSNVFTKEEPLKPSKAESRSVRTVVGIAFTHYVRQLVTNFFPDHNYHPWDTPGKVGMSINGVNFDRLARVVCRHANIFAGDMTAFDSSQGELVVRLVAAIRKKGYDTHKDYGKICELIDITYEALLKQPMGFKNIGLILKKDQGFTTGHGSTSGDNTLALLVNYLYAWRKVTGLRAREFYHYNSLINLGDDHVLGWDAVFGWSPTAAIQAMKDLGTTMRDEAPGIPYIPLPKSPMPDAMPDKDWRKSPLKFLSKVWIPRTGQVLAELEQAGIDGIVYPTCHDPVRLTGRMAAFQRMRKIGDTFKSYNVGLAYVALTSHHPELYAYLTASLVAHRNAFQAGWVKAGITAKQIKPIPSYNKVLRDWYSDSGKFDFDIDHEKAEAEDTPAIVLLTHDDAFAFVVRWIADFPTLLSPRYLNSRWADWLQSKLPSRMSWPLTFVGEANGGSGDVQSIMWHTARTPYAFLRNPSLLSGREPFGVLLVRHWFTMVLFRFVQRGRALSVFDYTRLLDNFVSNVTFFFTGSLSTVVIELDLHLLESIIIILASYINLDSGIAPLEYNIPTASLFVSRIASSVLRSLFPSGSVDMQPFEAIAGRLAAVKKHAFQVSAPTGTSKSTRMMDRLSSVTKVKVVVIQPRHLVCVGVGKYMQSLFPNSGIGIQTEGYQAQPTDRLVYTTAQSFMMSTELKNAPIVVLDEAHIDEPMYNVMRNALPKLNCSVMYLTATPPEGLKVEERLEVPAVNSFIVTRVDRQVNTYKAYEASVRNYLLAKPGNEKVLVFAVTKRSAAAIGSGLPKHAVCYLSSTQTVVKEGASIYISTSVADAGLTIPDVETVFSPDFDIQVSASDDRVAAEEAVAKQQTPLGKLQGVRQQDVPIIRYFRLPATTIRQRQGRTGRTCDGVFYYVACLNQVTAKKEYTFLDYMNGCSPAHRQCYPYFPADIRAEADPELKKAPKLWDYAGSVSMWRFAFLHYYWKHGLIKFEGQVVTRDSKPHYSTFTKFLEANGDFIKERMVALRFDPEATPEDLVEKEDPVDDGKPLGQDERPRSPVFELARRNVPGVGLLCGVHAIRGAVATRLGFWPPFDVVHQMCRRATMEDPNHDGQADIDRFYDWHVLVHVIWGHYHIKVQLRLNGRDQPMMGDIRLAPGEPLIIYLDGIHYNYHGVRYQHDASNPDEDLTYRTENPMNPMYAID